MSIVVAALAPVFLVIALGALLKRTLLRNAEAWDAFERLTYFVLFPALLVVTTATADLSGVPAFGIGASLFFAVLGLSVALVTARPLLMRARSIDGPAFTSVFQGATRWNTYIGLAVAGSLYGALGLALVSVAIIAIVPLVNVLCVIVLARYTAYETPAARTIFIQVARNPFIWSSLAGLALNLSGVPLPKLAVAFGEILGRGSLALGLLIVGAGLELDKLLRPDAPTLLTAALKLIAMPAIALGLALILGLSGPGLVVVAIASSVPSAPNAYVLARQMGGDAPLLARILTVETVVALLTMPLVLALAERLAQ